MSEQRIENISPEVQEVPLPDQILGYLAVAKPPIEALKQHARGGDETLRRAYTSLAGTPALKKALEHDGAAVRLSILTSEIARNTEKGSQGIRSDVHIGPSLGSSIPSAQETGRRETGTSTHQIRQKVIKNKGRV